MRVNPLLAPIIFIVALLGTVFAAQRADLWSTSGRTAVTSQQLAPADIKGWMTLQQVSDGLGINQVELYQIAHIPAEVPVESALKDLESIVPGFDITALRDALSTQNALVTPTAQPAATSVLTATEVPVPEDSLHATPTALPTGQVLPGSDIKGRMTLQEVSDQCAVPLDEFLQALKLPADTDPNAAIKDLVAQGKLTEVSVAQQAVIKLQSK